MEDFKIIKTGAARPPLATSMIQSALVGMRRLRAGHLLVNTRQNEEAPPPLPGRVRYFIARSPAKLVLHTHIGPSTQLMWPDRRRATGSAAWTREGHGPSSVMGCVGASCLCESADFSSRRLRHSAMLLMIAATQQTTWLPCDTDLQCRHVSVV
jgi:hypothetical protein